MYDGQEWNHIAGGHIIDRWVARVIEAVCTCPDCGVTSPLRANYCIGCGCDVGGAKKIKLAEVLQDIQSLSGGLSDEQKKQKFEHVFPSMGIYIYYHPYEKYKIGQAEIVARRISKHECAAPSLVLLHVIETSDLNWCERFLHNKFRHCRIHANHEYFNLDEDDLDWLFSIKVLEPPRTLDAQLSLLDLL